MAREETGDREGRTRAVWWCGRVRQERRGAEPSRGQVRRTRGCGRVRVGWGRELRGRRQGATRCWQAKAGASCGERRLRAPAAAGASHSGRRSGGRHGQAQGRTRVLSWRLSSSVVCVHFGWSLHRHTCATAIVPRFCPSISSSKMPWTGQLQADTPLKASTSCARSIVSLRSYYLAVGGQQWVLRGPGGLRPPQAQARSPPQRSRCGRWPRAASGSWRLGRMSWVLVDITISTCKHSAEWATPPSPPSPLRRGGVPLWLPLGTSRATRPHGPSTSSTRAMRVLPAVAGHVRHALAARRRDVAPVGPSCLSFGPLARLAFSYIT